MRLTVKELIARAYEVARVLKDADAALLREVATRLDVTYVALSEAMERNHQLESENANMLSFINTDCFVKDGVDFDYASTRQPLTPATERFLPGIKSDEAAPLISALKVIANSEQHNGDTVVCDFDTLISVAANALRDYYVQKLRDEVKP
ncbi:hypothetical protein [Superficieibacter sp. 1612_C1]|uniref:hypothetical protein n=1 Tax=Superficieibacter sp. 1612_C1 TaxID=2780382 RepID=UPI0018842594|nr:hypothetical protein [Superficieibacter sp. 1612_C1]